MKKRNVIMIRTLDDVGDIGEVISVSRGYARNYLIPRGYALADSEYARNFIKAHHNMIAHARAQRRTQAEDYKVRIEQEPYTIKMRASESGKLFGAVTSHMIAEALAARGVHVDTKAIRIPEHKIHALGTHNVSIHLDKDLDAVFVVQVDAQEG